MPFSFFKKKEKKGEIEVVLPEERATTLEDDIQFLVDYFHEITRELSKVEHNAAVSEREISKINKISLDFRNQVRKLVKREPQEHIYWNNFLNLCEDYVSDARRILPNSMYELPLDHQKVEELGKASRRNVSDFIRMLEDLKMKLSKSHKKTYNVVWPQRGAF